MLFKSLNINSRQPFIYLFIITEQAAQPAGILRKKKYNYKEKFGYACNYKFKMYTMYAVQLKKSQN